MYYLLRKTRKIYETIHNTYNSLKILRSYTFFARKKKLTWFEINSFLIFFFVFSKKKIRVVHKSFTQPAVSLLQKYHVITRYDIIYKYRYVKQNNIL